QDAVVVAGDQPDKDERGSDEVKPKRHLNARQAIGGAHGAVAQDVAELRREVQSKYGKEKRSNAQDERPGIDHHQFQRRLSRVIEFAFLVGAYADMDRDAGPPLPQLDLSDDLIPYPHIIGGSCHVELHKIFLAIDKRAYRAFELEAIKEEMQRRRLAFFIGRDAC